MLHRSQWRRFACIMWVDAGLNHRDLSHPACNERREDDRGRAHDSFRMKPDNCSNLRDHRRTRALELAVFCAVPCSNAAAACSRNAFTNRSRSEALGHMSPIRRAKERPPGTGSLRSDGLSDHGDFQSGKSDTPSPRSTMAAIGSNWSISKSSRGRIPTLRR
jgi:hypothetical protein